MTTTSNMSDFCNQVVLIIAEQLAKKASDLRPELNLRKDLGADSLDLIEILIRIEEDLGVKIPLEQAGELETLGDALSLAERERGGRDAPARSEADPESVPGRGNPDG